MCGILGGGGEGVPGLVLGVPALIEGGEPQANGADLNASIADVCRGWSFRATMQDGGIPALTTRTKLHHYGFGRLLGGVDLFALQGFDPALLNFEGMSYAALAKLAGNPPLSRHDLPCHSLATSSDRGLAWHQGGTWQ